jgi:hypothetical protein
MYDSEKGLDTDSAPAERRRSWKRAAIALGILAWVGGVAWGIQKIEHYSSTPGMAAEAPAQWPGSALVAPQAGRSTLVMFMHPQCSCTSASLEELKTIVERTHGAVAAWVVVLKPSGMNDEWAQSGTWETARNMSGVTVVMDDNGGEADRFGAFTSGHTVLYSADGTLQFSGGITAARGHVGENSGERSVINFVASGKADSSVHEVYGCGLHDPAPPMNDDQTSRTNGQRKLNGERAPKDDAAPRTNDVGVAPTDDDARARTIL